MNTNDYQRLKIAAEQFYLNAHQDMPKMDDREYDALAKIYESETGQSVKSIIPWDTVGKVEHIKNVSSLEKDQVQDNNLIKAAEDWIARIAPNEVYFTYKWDGSSCRCYFENGKLARILGAPDETFGFLRTESLRCLFPQEVDPSIESLIGEVIVDAELFGLNARNKANGLVNSKNMAEDIAKYAMVRVYRVTFHDEKGYNFERQKDALGKLPTLFSGSRCIFAPTIMLNLDMAKLHCNTNIALDYSGKTLIDGIVVYTDKGFRAFKFYYNEKVATTVRDVTWTLQKTGNLYPKLTIDPIEIDGKKVAAVAGGSEMTLRSLHAGVGARVEIIMANSTIPKIIQVLEPSDDFRVPEDMMQYSKLNR